tara:strand:- start:272 stop:697 length:426 start_codon:yes stop_codon:yes gene_type:complete
MKDEQGQFDYFFRWRIVDEDSSSGGRESDEYKLVEIPLPPEGSPLEEDLPLSYEQLIGQWVFEVATLEWPHPHEPARKWHIINHWAEEPSTEIRRQAESAILQDTRYFKTCSMCNSVTNVGYMHSDKVCDGCAEKHLGIIH